MLIKQLHSTTGYWYVGIKEYHNNNNNKTYRKMVEYM